MWVCVRVSSGEQPLRAPRTVVHAHRLPGEAENLLPAHSAPRAGTVPKRLVWVAAPPCPHRVLPALCWDQGGDAAPFLSHVLEKAGWLRFPGTPLPPQRTHTHTYTHPTISTTTTTTSKRAADSFSPGDRVPGQMPAVG